MIMSTHSSSRHAAAPLDLSRWARLPNQLIAGGGALAVLGALLSLKSDHGIVQFGYSWLLAFMFVLSLCLGSLFLVMVHHLFDAGWSVPPRRFLEHIASMLFPWMAILFVPIAVLAHKIYPWMHEANPESDEAIVAKFPLFTTVGFYVVVVLNFFVWRVLSQGLRKWSIAQDATGDAKCTFKMRGYSYWGIFAFAITLTLAAVMWMKALQHQWFSTMYGVWYFAGSVWTTLGTAYAIMTVLNRQRVLTHVLHDHQFYFMGTLFFAFTVFYAYITFAQYFIIWNANMPEETFWYVVREYAPDGTRSSWFFVSMVIIFGHFFLPFLGLLRIDLKSSPVFVIPLAIWGWLMHYTDLSFNIMPVLHPEGFAWKWVWLDFGCIALMVGVMARVFLAKYREAAPYPLKDPRLIEAMGHTHPIPTQISGGELDEADELIDGPAYAAKGGDQ
jgi:hypothetical protein